VKTENIFAQFSHHLILIDKINWKFWGKRDGRPGIGDYAQVGLTEDMDEEPIHYERKESIQKLEQGKDDEEEVEEPEDLIQV